MTFRDDIESCVDGARQCLDDLGLRVHTVVVRTRVWSGGVVGNRPATDTDVTLTPKPKVREPSPRDRFAAPGKYEAGDRVVEKISRSYTEAQLGGGDVAAGTEVRWRIDDEDYRLVGLTKGNFAWKAHLRRMNRK